MTATGDSKSYGIIYLVTHNESGKMYIGQTTKTIKARWAGHQLGAECVLLHNAINKYGPENFEISELDFAGSKEELDNLEIFWIDFLGTRRREVGYNLRGGGSFGKHSPESKQKMVVSLKKAYACDPTLRKRMSASRVGKPLSAEHRAKIAASNTGVTPDEATRLKMAAIKKAAWADPVYAAKIVAAQNAGKNCLEFREQASIKNKALWQDPEKRALLLKTQAAGKAAFWADPVKRAARIAKRAATIARNKAAKVAQI